MKCDNCGKEENWLEMIGGQFICHKCINKHKEMGLLLRTDLKAFQIVLKKLKIQNYDDLMNVKTEDVKKLVPLGRYR